MEAPESTCPAPSARDQPAPALGHPGVPNGQASPQLTLSPVILPPEQGLPPTVFLKALPIPLYHTVPPGGLQPRAPLVAGSLDGSAVPFILSPLLQPEGPGPTQVGKPAAPALTVNIVGTLPVLSPGLGSTLGNPGKVRNAGKYLCPHCGRDCLKPSVLEKHIRSHTGERPFPCSICGVAFKTQSNLYKHRRTQTHLNNSRLSLESEGGGSSLPEEGDRPGESCSADGRGDEAEPESALSPGAHPPLAAKALDMKTEAASCAGSTLAHREVPGAANHLPSPGLPLASPQSRWKLPESKPCSLQRQQEVCSEKPWEAKASEGRLRKCESTDSGYLSRSDSAEQPLAASSPLHSLSEHSTESEGEGGPGPRSGDTKAELATPGTSLELEKKRLEERITRLISHNQAVVDDPHLDHVRPRKTGLSKQGSIDLPMPYTYKDSFHFDIRALEPSRRRAALSPACSTFTPVDKSRPLFFHSVPTQLSTTVECVPITRSNSLPFIEGPKMWPEPRDLQDTCPRMRKPLSPRLTPAWPGCRSGLTLADIPTGHPRALVRQAAVEDLPCTPPGDTSAPAEDLDGKTARAAVGTVKGRGSKKNCQRKMRMFSQEKWQVYGNETFKRIYQKMKTSHQGGQKARAELDLPPQEEAIGVKGASLPYDSRTSVLGDSPVKAKPGFWESQPVPEGALEAKSPQKMRAMAKPEGSDQLRVAKTELSPTLSHRASPCLGSRSPGRLDLEYQLPPAPGSIPREALETPRQPSPDLQVEVDISGDGSTKDICSRAQMMLRRPSGGSGEPTLAGDKLPSERKKLKVEGLDPQEQPGPLGTETSGSSTQAASLPSQQQDGDLGEMPGGSREHARKGVAPPASSGISSTASAAAPAESGNKESLRPPSASVPRHHPTQPQTPSVLAALTDRTFAPKYLLRLPQGETSSPPATPGPGQGRDSLCTRVSPGSGPGTPIPSSGPAPSETCSTPEDPGWSRPEDGRDEVPSEGRTDTSVPVAGSSSTSAKGGTWEIASMLPTCTCDAHRAQDMGGETHSICHLGTGSPTGARTCAGLLNARSPAGKLGVPPKNAPKGMPSESTAGDPSSCPFQACYFLKALPRPQRVPEPPLSPHLGSPGSGRGPSSFPSLKAEPQLTWCCLSRSLPLPTEQEKATSGHWSLPSPGGSLWDERRDLPRQSRGERSGAGACGGGAEPTPELSYVTVPAMRPPDPAFGPQKKKGPCRRRVRPPRGSSKRKWRLLARRCEGSFCRSRAQLRASRLHRPPWVPRRSHVEPRARLRRASSAVTGLNMQGQSSCISTEWLLGHGNGEREENENRQISEPRTNSRMISKRDESTLQAISPCAGKRGDGSHEKDAADGSGPSLQLNSCLAVAKDAPLPQGKGPDAELLRIQLLPSQDQVSIDPKLCILPDVQEPSSFESEGTFPCHDIAASAVAMCIPLGRITGPRTLGIYNKEPQEHRWAVGETVTQSLPDRKDTAESPSPARLPGKPSPRQETSHSAPLGSPEKSHVERPDSGPSLSSSHQEGRSQTDFSSRGQYGSGEVAMPCSTLGSDDGKSLALGFITAKGCAAPSAPGKPFEGPEANSRSVGKRSLEGMRKQARVELSDTSSDDEDRLVIEM